jgi:hypothetical protein
LDGFHGRSIVIPLRVVSVICDISYSAKTDTNGTTTEKTTDTSVDKKANGTTTTVVTTTTTTHPDGSTDTTVHKEVTDPSGNTSSSDEKSSTPPPPPPAPPVTPEPGDNCGGMTDPDYVGTGPISDAQFRSVLGRLKGATDKGPDDGNWPPTMPIGGPGSRIPTIALVSGDGVTVLAAGATPRFNPLQPDYDPRLTDLGELGGVTPTRGPSGVVTWS